MALTDAQVGMLDVLTYENEGGGGIFSASDVKQGATLGDIVNRYLASGNETNADRALLEAIASDPDLSSLRLIDIDSYNARGSRALAFQSQDAADTYVVFKGTGTGETIEGDATNSEWYTDAMGLSSTDTQPQREAKAYLEYIEGRFGGSITATGHSNGANKAMYGAITTDVVDRCVVFDGQGFSAEFLDKYADRIDQNAHLISYYGLEGDYVGPLLLPLPIDKRYIKYGDSFDPDDPLNTFAMNHGMDSFYTSFIQEDGSIRYEFSAGEQSEFSREIENLIQHICDNTTHEELSLVAPVMGELLDSLRGSKGKSVGEVFSDENNRAGVLLLVGLLVSYDGLSDFVSAGLDAFGDSMSEEDRRDFELLLQLSSNLYSVLTHFGLGAFLGTMIDTAGISLKVGGSMVLGLSHAALGFDPMRSNLVRDFSEEKRQELLSIVREIENEQWFDPTRWDVVYRAEKFFGRLNIANYQNDMRTYYRKVADIEGTTEAQVNRIFAGVEAASKQYQRRVQESLGEALAVIQRAAPLTA